jgi:hypothetical protein
MVACDSLVVVTATFRTLSVFVSMELDTTNSAPQRDRSPEPLANPVWERFGGTLRRQCLDYLIPLHERHLQLTTQAWVRHYHHGRPHSSLGPGATEPNQERVPAYDHRHKLPAGYRVAKTSVLAGLHHEFAW